MKRALPVLLLFTGCAHFAASPADYAAYRKTRTSQTLEARLSAAQSYLQRYPEGTFVPDVRAYFDHAESVYYKAKQGSAAGLHAYLATLPEGPHQKDAKERLAIFEARQAAKNSGPSVEDIEARLDQAAEERLRVRETLSSWLTRLLDPALFDRPLVEAPSAFLVPWSVSLPSPVCQPVEEALPELPEGAARRCHKILELPYSVIVDGAPDPRQATIEVSLIQDEAGRPLVATLGGPDLFLRLEETYTVRAMSYDESEQRIAAIARAIELVKTTFGRKVSTESSCKRTVVAPVFLELACQGVRVTARAADAPGEDDVLLVQPEDNPPHARSEL